MFRRYIKFNKCLRKSRRKKSNYIGCLCLTATNFISEIKNRLLKLVLISVKWTTDCAKIQRSFFIFRSLNIFNTNEHNSIVTNNYKHGSVQESQESSFLRREILIKTRDNNALFSFLQTRMSNKKKVPPSSTEICNNIQPFQLSDTPSKQALPSHPLYVLATLITTPTRRKRITENSKLIPH